MLVLVSENGAIYCYKTLRQYSLCALLKTLVSFLVLLQVRGFTEKRLEVQLFFAAD